MNGSAAHARPPVRKAGQITNPVLRERLRQLALFAAMLISGGILSIPREPLIVMVLVLCFMLNNPLRLLRAEFLLVWLLLFATGAMALVGGESFQLLPMTIRYANFIAGLALLLVYVGESRTTLANDLFPILKLMAFQAILTPFAYLFASGLFTTFQVYDTTYHTLLYVFTYHELVDTGSILKRPDGFFFEPGVFQIYLNMLLFIGLFVRKQRLFDIVLAALAVVATQSTTGVVIMMLQFAVAYFQWLKTASRRQKVGVFVFVPILLLPLAAYMSFNLSQKFYGALSGSAEAREYDLRTGISVALEHPVTGIGFDYQKYFDVSARVGYREANLSRDNITERGNTNGIVVLLFSVGIPLSLIFLLGIVFQRMFRPRLLFAALILLSLIAESLFFTPIVLMIAFSGLLIQPRRIARLLRRRPATAPVRPQSA
ncbi:O-antigen ligase family protein [Erythrobacter sp. JK5]|uniref:O-antigen ligase family protein n=1 Tax=Erythrobacter sp. JK5 TaxID=2829500 RepID=UPI001BAD012B|nr:O-antigen ligase family protein [Erythrobacter sp. JK5]QUL37328.1 O-antigen ligase family protein [Erythrobacter sp. JK5]